MLCFSLDSRVRGNDVLTRGNDGAGVTSREWRGIAGITVRRVNDVRIVVIFGHPLRASHASPSLREGEGNGVLCLSLDSRVRGNDGGVAGMTDTRECRGNDV